MLSWDDYHKEEAAPGSAANAINAANATAALNADAATAAQTAATAKPAAAKSATSAAALLAEVQIDTARRWVKDLQEAGMVATHGKKRHPTGGRPAELLAVTKQWGGVA